MQQRPPSLLGAAAVQAADAVIVVAASVLAGVDTFAGQSYQRGSGIALTLIGIATAVALAWIALALSRGRRWSRTPTVLTQLFVAIVGIYLVQGHRYAWGIPCLLLACAGVALLLVPASLRALADPRPADAPPAAAAPPPKTPPARTPPPKTPPSRTPPSKNSPSRKPPSKRPARG